MSHWRRSCPRRPRAMSPFWALSRRIRLARNTAKKTFDCCKSRLALGLRRKQARFAHGWPRLARTLLYRSIENGRELRACCTERVRVRSSRTRCQTCETSALAWARRMPRGLDRSPPNLSKPGAFFLRPELVPSRRCSAEAPQLELMAWPCLDASCSASRAAASAQGGVRSSPLPFSSQSVPR